MNIFTNYDFNHNQTMNMVVHNLASAPTVAVEGQEYYNTTVHRRFTFNGTEWIGNDALGAMMTGENIAASINASSALIDLDNLPTTVQTTVTNSHTHSNKGILDATTASFLVAHNTKLGFISVTQAVDLDTMESNVTTNNAKVTNANHTGDVTGSTTLTITANAVTNAKLALMPTMTIKGNNTGATATALDLTATQVRTLLNVSDGANNYIHPTSDGSLHVPATGTTNNGKVLTAGATAGVLTWETPTVTWTNISGKPSSTTANIDLAVTNMHTHSNKALLDTYAQTETNIASAVSLKHSQNTDTGTSSTTFTIGSSGVKIKNVSGTELQARNNADSDYADLRVKNLYVEGSTTTINSNTVAIGDSEIELNTDITTSATNSDGGIVIKRLKADNVTRADAKMTFNNSTGRWQSTFGAVSATLVTLDIANKKVATLGDGTNSTFVITHNMNTRDIVTAIRSTASPYDKAEVDIDFTTLDTLTVKFGNPIPTAGQFTITMIG